MSTSIDVFVAPGCRVEQVIECLERGIGYSLERTTNRFGDPIYFKSVPGFDLTAYDNHRLEDDAGIEFSRYNIQVGFEPDSYPYYELREDLCRILALLTASAIRDELSCECLVVRGLQRVIEYFPPGRGKGDGGN